MTGQVIGITEVLDSDFQRDLFSIGVHRQVYILMTNGPYGGFVVHAHDKTSRKLVLGGKYNFASEVKNDYCIDDMAVSDLLNPAWVEMARELCA